MKNLHQRPFSAAGVGSVFCTEGGMPDRSEPSGGEFLENSFRQIRYSSKQNNFKKKQNSESIVLLEITH